MNLNYPAAQTRANLGYQPMTHGERLFGAVLLTVVITSIMWYLFC